MWDNSVARHDTASITILIDLRMRVKVERASSNPLSSLSSIEKQRFTDASMLCVLQPSLLFGTYCARLDLHCLLFCFDPLNVFRWDLSLLCFILLSNPCQVLFWSSNAIDASQWAVAAMDLSTLHFGIGISRCIPFYTSCLFMGEKVFIPASGYS